MLKEEVEYKNLFTDEPVKETLYFHLSKANLIQMEVDYSKESAVNEETGEEITGVRAHFYRIGKSTDPQVIMSELDELLKRCYGKRDGERFLQSKDIWTEFRGSEAYSEFIFGMLRNPEKMANFIASVMPGDIEKMAAEIEAAAEAATQGSTPDGALAKAPTVPENGSEPRLLTQAEVEEMDAADLKFGLSEGRYKLS